jgi:hypothetical protein
MIKLAIILVILATMPDMKRSGFTYRCTFGLRLAFFALGLLAFTLS